MFSARPIGVVSIRVRDERSQAWRASGELWDRSSLATLGFGLGDIWGERPRVCRFRAGSFYVSVSFPGIVPAWLSSYRVVVFPGGVFLRRRRWPGWIPDANLAGIWFLLSTTYPEMSFLEYVSYPVLTLFLWLDP